MRFRVAPEFSEKLAQVSSDEIGTISEIVKFVEATEKDSLEAGAPGIEIRNLNDEILSIKRREYRVYASFGHDDNGEYLLLLDISLKQLRAAAKSSFLATKDPRTNRTLDPNRNMMIDPRRNMMIDPRRNMMIDPNKNMMIDPRRNMMIDPNRNMMIDPNRNMMIDPHRNKMIDPRRNRYYGGPFIYSTTLEQEGFVVRANDEVSLIFDLSAQYTRFFVNNGKDGANVFDVSGHWVEFLITTQHDVRLRFDTTGQWIGLVV